MIHPELTDEAGACQILGGIHRSSLWRGINAGRLPRPLKIGPATNRWRVADLIAFIDGAAAARNGKAA
ncbi:hypothetical protein D3874_06960 [Oleomonas cavernae]|uniref:AlpA family phage regulatory protein n=1 Tax=Oleomonas cavernae TaxID=2320859 RepID=A0A418W9V2_9PROT|nr:hypothetical protein [Oleomonas cavernae]RJF86790.1 hypothetical protein D3874_06960 [Oleomonas cavernae]